jgi:hypothetical protein
MTRLSTHTAPEKLLAGRRFVAWPRISRSRYPPAWRPRGCPANPSASRVHRGWLSGAPLGPRMMGQSMGRALARLAQQKHFCGFCGLVRRMVFPPRACWDHSGRGRTDGRQPIPMCPNRPAETGGGDGCPVTPRLARLIPVCPPHTARAPEIGPYGVAAERPESGSGRPWGADPRAGM